MDALDAALVRAVMRDGVYDFEGMDPRRSHAALARAVGVSRNTVRARLGSWRSSGFHSGTAVFVNPDLVGRRFVGRFHVVRNPAALASVESALTRSHRLFLVYPSGSILGREISISTLWVVDSKAELDAEMRASDGIEELQSVTAPFEIPFPPSSIEMTALDWGIARTFRSFPELGAPGVAARLGVSTRHLRRRLSRLLDGNALFFWPALNLSKSRGSVLLVAVFFEDSLDASSLTNRLRGLYPDLVPIARRGRVELAQPPQADGVRLSALAFLLPVRTVQQAGDVMVALRAIDGLREVGMGFAIRSYENRSCFDRILELAPTGARASGPTRTRGARIGRAEVSPVRGRSAKVPTGPN